MSGFIYAIECGDAVKIGFAKEPKSRLVTLQIGSPAPCRLLGVKAGTHEDELALHRQFSELRIRGEWFSKNGPVLDFISELSDDFGEDVGQVIHVRVGRVTLKALNKEWKRRDAPSRSEIVRSILDEWAKQQ